jgi:hypothetical protein
VHSDLPNTPPPQPAQIEIPTQIKVFIYIFLLLHLMQRLVALFICAQIEIPCYFIKAYSKSFTFISALFSSFIEAKRQLKVGAQPMSRTTIKRKLLAKQHHGFTEPN